MRMRLKNFRETPPEFYRYCDPDTGVWTKAWDIDVWFRKAKERRLANGYPVPADMEAIMQDQLCQVLPPGWCEYDDESRPRVDTRLSWGDVESGSKTFIDWAAQGRPLVDQSEAERRGKICANCYLNVRATGCGQSCRELIRRLVGLFLDRKTSVDDKLNSCSACKCMMRVKVHFPIDLIEAHSDAAIQQLFPEFCWLKRGGSNYLP